jgi:hypothetical protein
MLSRVTNLLARTTGLICPLSLRGVPTPTDINVIPESKFRESADIDRLFYKKALQYGKVVYFDQFEPFHACKTLPILSQNCSRFASVQKEKLSSQEKSPRTIYMNELEIACDLSAFRIPVGVHSILSKL